MALADELRKERFFPSACAMRTILDSLDGDEKAALLEAIEKCRSDERHSRTKVYSFEWLAKTLSDNGYPIGRTTVSRHINGGCGCGKSG